MARTKALWLMRIKSVKPWNVVGKDASIALDLEVAQAHETKQAEGRPFAAVIRERDIDDVIRQLQEAKAQLIEAKVATRTVNRTLKRAVTPGGSRR